MRSKVSRSTFKLSDGRPACITCLKRPQRWDGTRWQSYCTVCHTDYCRKRRQGKTETLLTPEVREVVRALQGFPLEDQGAIAAEIAADIRRMASQYPASGRHHASSR